MHENKLAEQLWIEDGGNDDNGDEDNNDDDKKLSKALNALSANTTRLRQLLGDKEAITVSARQLSLNSNYCWVDAFTFEQQCRHIRRNLEIDQTTVMDELLNLYRGRFLPNEEDTVWVLGPRQRLHDSLISTLQSVARQQESQKNWSKALHWYQQGLEHDDLCEPFCQGLLRCYRELGQHAEALDLYRRFEQRVLTELERPLARETQAIYQEILRLSKGDPN